MSCSGRSPHSWPSMQHTIKKVGLLGAPVMDRTLYCAASLSLLPFPPTQLLHLDNPELFFIRGDPFIYFISCCHFFLLQNVHLSRPVARPKGSDSSILVISSFVEASWHFILSNTFFSYHNMFLHPRHQSACSCRSLESTAISKNAWHFAEIL